MVIGNCVIGYCIINIRGFMQRRGFTLIEVLTILTMMALMMSIGLMALFTARQNRQVANVALKVKSILEETRAYAFAPPDKANNATIHADHIEVQIDKHSKAITFYALQGAGRTQIINPPLVGDTYIPSNISFGNGSGQYKIDIDISDPNTRGQFSGPNNCIVLSDSSSSTSYQLIIQQYGEMEVSKGNSCP